VDRNFEPAFGVLESSLLLLAETSRLAEGALRNVCFVLIAVLAIGIPSTGQTPASTSQAPPPQTARQALIEMFTGKSPDAFVKHLPAAASQALLHKGEMPGNSMVQRISTIGRQWTTQEHQQIFDEGPTLLVSEQEEGQQKVKTEVDVERDNLMGESDEIEVSIHVYRDGMEEFLPVVPRLIFSMTQEKEIWKLTEATLAAHVPLTDPDYLKGVRKEEDKAIEGMASGRIRMIAAAEVQFASSHPDRGYSCNLTELFSKGDSADAADQPPEFSAAGFASDSSGYHFSLTDCDGTPALRFHATAVPAEADSGMKAFCADESGKVRFEVNGKGSSCLTRGQLLYSGPENAAVQLD
jgi:hypothetical protein